MIEGTRTYRVLCEYHQFALGPFGVDPILDPRQPAELAQVNQQEGFLVVLTGIASGPVEVEVDTAKQHDPDTGWEEQETSMMEITEPLFVTAPTIKAMASPDPVFVPAVPGPHRVTVLARSRKLRYDENLTSDAEAAEQYRITISTPTG